MLSPKAGEGDAEPWEAGCKPERVSGGMAQFNLTKEREISPINYAAALGRSKRMGTKFCILLFHRESAKPD